MKEPVHSNRKLFNNDDQNLKSEVHKSLEHDKENNCFNTKTFMPSPIPSIKGKWTNIISPTPMTKPLMMASSPQNQKQSPMFVLQSINSNKMTTFGTPQNTNLKGSIVAPSTCGSTQVNFGNFRNTGYLKSNDTKSRNLNMKQLSTGNSGAISNN